MARLEDTEKRHNTHMVRTLRVCLYRTRMSIPYAYGTENRTVRVWYIPYAYGTKYAYGIEHADCERLLCQECYKPHTRMKMYQSHKTMTKEDFMTKNPKLKVSLQYCKEHVTQDLALYCKTCNCLICRDCTFVDHKHHNYNFIVKLIDDESKKIQDVVTTLHDTAV